MHRNPKIPLTLIASGLDPSGSAGLIADVRVMSNLGCHTCGVVTCETIQNSKGVKAVYPSNNAVLRDQINSIVSDLRPQSIKIGAIASLDTANVLRETLSDLEGVPIVIDPVLKPTKGDNFLSTDDYRKLADELFGMATLATPNITELFALADFTAEPVDEAVLEAARIWIKLGLKAVLVTGLIRGENVIDRLIDSTDSSELQISDFSHPIIKTGEIHGTGCVLSSAIAAFLAFGENLTDASRRGSEYTFGVIKKAGALGSGSSFWTL